MAKLVFNPFTGSLDYAEAGAGSYTPPNIGTWSHLGGIAARDAVYIQGDGVVDLADANGPGTQPLIGLVLTVDGPSCIVQYSGEMGGFTGLAPGDIYYLSTTGISGSTITNVAPDIPPETPPLISQKVGIAKSSTVLIIKVDTDFTEVG